MAASFRDFLEARWRQLGINQAAFAKLIGQNDGYVSAIRLGKKNPPLKKMEGWASALELKGDERELFFELAQLEHSPKRIRILLTEYRRKLRENKMKLDAAVQGQAQLERLLEEIKDASRDDE